MTKTFEQFRAEPATRMVDIAPDSINEKEKTVDVAFSSETPVRRWGFDEVLSHESGACDLSRLLSGANALWNHDIDKYIGVVENARIDADRIGRATIRFSENEDAQKIFADIKNKILRQISVGYRIIEAKLTEEKEDGNDVYTVTRWMPYEISVVTVAADISVGVGRSANINQKSPKEMPATPEQPPAPPATVDEGAIRADAIKSEQSRVRSLLEMGKEYSLPELAQRAIAEGMTIETFRKEALDETNKRNQEFAKKATAPVGLSPDESKRFSFTKLLRVLTSPNDKAAVRDAAFELEVVNAAEAQRSAHGGTTHGGYYIPVDVLMQRGTNIVSQSIATAGYTGTAGSLTPTTLLSGSFIELLRNRTVAMKLGTTMGGLFGNIDIPKQTSGASGYWLNGEDSAAGASDVNFGLLQLRMKTCAAKVTITRNALRQTSPDVEMVVRQDIIAGQSLTIDRGFFYGTNATGQPLGMKNVAGINAVNFAAVNPTFAELVSMETQIASDNADVNSMRYVFNAAMRGHFKTTKKFADSNDSATLWEPGNMVNGYGTDVTNQIDAGDVFFGNWADAIIGLWGGLELALDTATGADKGNIKIIAFQDVDFGLRHPESICYGVKPA